MKETTPALPKKFRVQVAPDVRIFDAGRTLVGGAPLRVLRLREPAPRLEVGGVVEVADETTRVVAQRLLATGLGTPMLRTDDRPSPESISLTVVVPIRDRADRLDRLLDRLRGLDVIVVDDASRDPVAVATVANRHGAHLIALDDNVGPAGARNAGLQIVDSDYVAFVDSDVVISADDLAVLVLHFADPAVAAVGPRVRGVAYNARPRRFERWDVDGLSLDLGPVPALVRPWSKVGWLPSACLLVRTSDLTRPSGGAFETGRRVGEDVDLVWRLIRRGRHVRYDPSVTAEHDSRGTWSSWLLRKAFYGTGGAWLAQRHGDWMAPAVLSPVPAVALVAMACQRRWSIPVAVCAMAAVRLRLGRSLPRTPDRSALATELTAEVTVSSARQGAHLLLRHWVPGTAVAALVSRRARRALLAAAVWDIIDHRGLSPTRIPEAFVARRLDDIAYGCGLWWGAARARSARALLPKLGLRSRSTVDVRTLVS